jgi:hypothetical protein
VETTLKGLMALVTRILIALLPDLPPLTENLARWGLAKYITLAATLCTHIGINLEGLVVALDYNSAFIPRNSACFPENNSRKMANGVMRAFLDIFEYDYRAMDVLDDLSQEEPPETWNEELKVVFGAFRRPCPLLGGKILRRYELKALIELLNPAGDEVFDMRIPRPMDALRRKEVLRTLRLLAGRHYKKKAGGYMALASDTSVSSAVEQASGEEHDDVLEREFQLVQHPDEDDEFFDLDWILQDPMFR